eukprot:351624-Chlamydomonas_euryale.AAC.7
MQCRRRKHALHGLHGLWCAAAITACHSPTQCMHGAASTPAYARLFTATPTKLTRGKHLECCVERGDDGAQSPGTLKGVRCERVEQSPGTLKDVRCERVEQSPGTLKGVRCERVEQSPGTLKGVRCERV